MAYGELGGEGLEELQSFALLGFPCFSPSPFCHTTANVHSKNNSDDQGRV